jgi:hypothetical protein
VQRVQQRGRRILRGEREEHRIASHGRLARVCGGRTGLEERALGGRL